VFARLSVLRDAPELGDEPQLGKLLLQGHSDVLARFKIHQPDEGALELRSVWASIRTSTRSGIVASPRSFRGDNARPPQRFRPVGDSTQSGLCRSKRLVGVKTRGITVREWRNHSCG